MASVIQFDPKVSHQHYVKPAKALYTKLKVSEDSYNSYFLIKKKLTENWINFVTSTVEG